MDSPPYSERQALSVLGQAVGGGEGPVILGRLMEMTVSQRHKAVSTMNFF